MQPMLTLDSPTAIPGVKLEPGEEQGTGTRMELRRRASSTQPTLTLDRKAYSSNAVGILFGLGHVDEHLGEYNEADTFMSTDAGISWKKVKKGVWTWQIGDQGSVVVLVQLHKVRTVSFTADEGQTWNDYEFGDHDVEVLDTLRPRRRGPGHPPTMQPTLTLNSATSTAPPGSTRPKPPRRPPRRLWPRQPEKGQGRRHTRRRKAQVRADGRGYRTLHRRDQGAPS